MNEAREKALEEFPAARPFADLIVGDTDEDFRAMVKVVHERVHGAQAQDKSDETPDVQASQTPEPQRVEPVKPEASTPETEPEVVVSPPKGTYDRLMDFLQKAKAEQGVQF